MTILITGGAGYIGSHVAYGLIDRGEHVVILDNLATGCRTAVPTAARFILGNAGDKELVSAVIAEHHIDSVIHLAASTAVSESTVKPAAYYHNNTSASLALLDVAARHRVKHVVFSSTAAVYGNAKQQPVDESAPPAPLSPYGNSKLMTELMLRDVAAVAPFSFAVLRYFNVAGADPQGRTGQSYPAEHLIRVTVQAALGLRAGIDLFGTDYPTPDGTCVRDYIHVTDIVGAHLAALDYLRNGGASITLNCGYGHGYSVREVIGAVKRISAVDFTVTERPRRPGDPASIVADTKAIRKLLSWAPAYDDLDVIVRHSLDWERRLMAQTGLRRVPDNA
jgi:UDP-glucose 4-epimerase